MGGSGAQPGLDPYPLDLLGCKGEVHDGGYYGRCCFEAHCYTPEGGVDCTTSADPALRNLLQDFPPGSGTCECMVGDMDSITGPFGPNPSDTPTGSGSCCYVVGGIGCEGRPFMIDGAPRVAPLVLRSDWGAFG